MIASEQDRPDIARRRRQWRRRQASIDPRRLVFIDETWTKTNMAPLRGWSLRGTRLKDQVPHGRWRTQTFLAALRHDRITAPFLLDGPINGQAFLIYVERVLTPTLNPGDVVVMDNLGAHKSKAVRDAIRSVGAHRIFLPAYLPDLIRSSRCSPSSRHCCAKPEQGRSATYQIASATCSAHSARLNAPTI